MDPIQSSSEAGALATPLSHGPEGLAPAAVTLEQEQSEYRRRRRRRRPEEKKQGRRFSLSLNTKAWLILGSLTILLVSLACWSYYLLDEMEALRRKMSSESFNAKERIASLESILYSPRLRAVSTLELEPQKAANDNGFRLVQIRRPENGAILINLVVPVQAQRWDLEMRDVAGVVRGKLTAGATYQGKVQVMLTDLELNTYTIVARARGLDSVYSFAFALN